MFILAIQCLHDIDEDEKLEILSILNTDIIRTEFSTHGIKHVVIRTEYVIND